ncbi:unnamed protein product, partial [Discosporangium mesarthrocarpum]
MNRGKLKNTIGDDGGSGETTSAMTARKRPRDEGNPASGKDWLLYPPDGSDPIDLRKEANLIFSALETSMCKDVCFELHRELHTGILTNERLHAEKLCPPAPKRQKGGDIYGRVPPREPSTNIICPSCGRSVGAGRYAPHLDKCALGSGRGGRSARGSRASPPPADSLKSISASASSSSSTTRASPPR